MSKGIESDVAGFGAALGGILEDFYTSCDADVKRAVNRGGKDCVSKLKETEDPRATGVYASGWKMKQESSGFGGYYVRVYNVSKPSLTHLLEFGHEKFIHGRDTGERVPAHPHIELAYEAAAEKVMEELRA